MNRVVIQSGFRTPFLRSNTHFNDIKAYELLRHSLISTVNQNNLNKEVVDYVIAGLNEDYYQLIN
jgi:acetyl-CoA acetyltransferase